MEVNFSRMELHRAGLLVALTPQEFKMLRFFLNNPERVISRTELLNEVWGYNNYPTTRTVDTHILRLAAKAGERSHRSCTFPYRARHRL